MRSGLTVLFAGGGTGGHLFPGLEVAREIERARPGAACVFCGTGRPAEARALEGTGFRCETLPAVPAPRRLLGWPGFVAGAARALSGAVRRVRAIAPDLVVGLGGYASAAPAAAAALGGTPVFLLEQNAVPGRANRLLSRLARAVFVPWPDAAGHFPRRAVVEPIGNPVRRSVLEPVAAADARARLGLDPDPARRTLLVMGGSQGARGLNQAVMARAGLLAARRKDLQVIHLAGAEDAPALERRYRDLGVRAHVAPYLERMEIAYSAADLALARAGGTSIAELQCRGLPAVLVPFPHAAEDHQTANGRAVERAGAAIVIAEAELARDGLSRAIALLFDGARRDEMARAARAAGRPDAARAIAVKLLDAVEVADG